MQGPQAAVRIAEARSYPRGPLPESGMMARDVLRSSWQFRTVYERGKKINCKHLVVFYHRTGETTVRPKFGVVASKRVGGAVERNRAKRLLREAARSLVHRMNIRDLWVVLVAKRAIVESTSSEVARELEAGWLGEGIIEAAASD